MRHFVTIVVIAAISVAVPYIGLLGFAVIRFATAKVYVDDSSGIREMKSVTWYRTEADAIAGRNPTNSVAYGVQGFTRCPADELPAKQTHKSGRPIPAMTVDQYVVSQPIGRTAGQPATSWSVTTTSFFPIREVRSGRVHPSDGTTLSSATYRFRDLIPNPEGWYVFTNSLGGWIEKDLKFASTRWTMLLTGIGLFVILVWRRYRGLLMRTWTVSVRASNALDHAIDRANSEVETRKAA